MPDIEAIRARAEKARAYEPCHWVACGEKSNDAVLGTALLMEGGYPPPGRVEEEVYDEEKLDYVKVCFIDEPIAFKDGNADYAKFDFLAHCFTDIPALLALTDSLTAERDELRREVERLTGEIARLMAGNKQHPVGEVPVGWSVVHMGKIEVGDRLSMADGSWSSPMNANWIIGKAVSRHRGIVIRPTADQSAQERREGE